MPKWWSLQAVRLFGRHSAAMIYAASKTAVARWIRRQAVTGDWAGVGIRLNALNPGQLADWMLFMLSDSADFLCGSVIFVDGGSAAYFRADSWPAALPARSLPRYAARFLAHNRSRR
jgi:hypothetical protein